MSLLMLAPSPHITGPVPGPIGRLAQQLARGLEEAGHNVDVELWGRHTADEGAISKLLGRAADLRRIRRRMRHHDYDVVLVHATHDPRALTRDLILVWTSPASVRWVFLIHGSRFGPDRRMLRFATGLLVRRVRAILLLSTEEIRQWHELYPQVACYLVANAFVPLGRKGDSAASQSPSTRSTEILFAGRLVREKGVYDLLEAIAALRDRGRIHLTVAGEGPERDGLARHAASLGIGDLVRFTGHLGENELCETYRRADAFVLPTYWGEGLPTVLLEAMSFGLPIITTRIRGAADYLVEGENALFVPARDPVRLAEAIVRLLDDDALRRHMSLNNSERVAAFAPDRVVAAYERAFEAVIAESGRVR